MPSFILSTLMLTLAATTSAMARTRRALSSTEVSLSLGAQGYSALPLTAVPGPTNNTVSLIFDPQTTSAGTPCYTNSTYLDFDLGCTEPFAMYVPQLGEVEGLSVPVLAYYGQENGRSGFVMDQQLDPPLDNGAEDFFACSGTVNGADALVLHFGVFKSDGSSPTGCVPASLNVEG